MKKKYINKEIDKIRMMKNTTYKDIIHTNCEHHLNICKYKRDTRLRRNIMILKYANENITMYQNIW